MIVVVGLSHHTAPIEVRERLALPPEAQDELGRRLLAHEAVGEVFVVSTCNRVEIVAASPGVTGDALEACVSACRRELEREAPLVREHLYEHVGWDGVRHLVRVAASLDSLVVGEPQILGQLKQSFERAKGAGFAGPLLERVFTRAVRGARRVRSETAIGAGQVSVPSIAIDLASQIFGNLKGHTAVLVGTGEMGQTVARLLGDAGARLIVVGRSAEKTAALARELGAEGRSIGQLGEVLALADIVVTSTSSEVPLIREKDVLAVKKVRRGRSLFFIDLAVPRDVEPSVGELDGVFLYNVDDLSGVAMESAEVRRKEATRAAELVEETVREFQRWASGEQVTPVVKALRSKFRRAFEFELERSLRGRLRGLDEEERRALAKLLDAGLNRVLHGPTMRLREQALGDAGLDVDDWTRILNHVFELEEEEAEAERAPELPSGPTTKLLEASGIVAAEDIEGGEARPRPSAGTRTV